jgi:hypothetical protein
MGHVSFTVEGAFLTNHCRDIVYERNWTKAINDLRHSLVGMTIDQAIQVLSGEMKLIGVDDGVNTIEMVKDGDPVWIERLASQYNGYFKQGPNWYRPFERIVSFNARDAQYKASDTDNPIDIDHHVYSDDNVNWTDLCIVRARTYCHNYSDIVLKLEYKGVPNPIICVRVEAPPLWWSDTKSPQEALDEYGTIAQTGAKCFNDPDLDEEYQKRADRAGNVDDALMIKAGRMTRDEINRVQNPMQERYGANPIKGFMDEMKKADEARKPVNLIRLRDEIRAKATMINMDFGGEFGIVSVPEEPFICWALMRSMHGMHL